MKSKERCQWCGHGFVSEQPIFDATIPASFRYNNPYHAPCLKRSRAAQRQTMRTLVKRINAVLKEDMP